jgi:hypothetical protein
MKAILVRCLQNPSPTLTIAAPTRSDRFIWIEPRAVLEMVSKILETGGVGDVA